MNIDLKNKWMNDPVVLAQIGHVLGAYSIVMTAAYLSGRGWIALAFAAALIVYASIKEFWYDANYEIPAQTTFDNVLDFSMYCVGVAVALLTMLIHHQKL